MFHKYIGRIKFAKFVPSKTAKYIHTQPTNLKNCSLKSSLFFKGLLQLHRNNLFRDRSLCFSSLSSSNVSLQLFYIFFRFCLPLNACWIISHFIFKLFCNCVSPHLVIFLILLFIYLFLAKLSSLLILLFFLWFLSDAISFLSRVKSKK